MVQPVAYLCLLILLLILVSPGLSKKDSSKDTHPDIITKKKRSNFHIEDFYFPQDMIFKQIPILHQNKKLWNSEKRNKRKVKKRKIKSKTPKSKLTRRKHKHKATRSLKSHNYLSPYTHLKPATLQNRVKLRLHVYDKPYKHEYWKGLEKLTREKKNIPGPNNISSKLQRFLEGVGEWEKIKEMSDEKNEVSVQEEVEKETQKLFKSEGITGIKNIDYYDTLEDGGKENDKNDLKIVRDITKNQKTLKTPENLDNANKNIKETEIKADEGRNSKDEAVQIRKLLSLPLHTKKTDSSKTETDKETKDEKKVKEEENGRRRSDNLVLETSKRAARNPSKEVIRRSHYKDDEETEDDDKTDDEEETSDDEDTDDDEDSDDDTEDDEEKEECKKDDNNIADKKEEEENNKRKEYEGENTIDYDDISLQSDEKNKQKMINRNNYPPKIVERLNYVSPDAKYSKELPFSFQDRKLQVNEGFEPVQPFTNDAFAKFKTNKLGSSKTKNQPLKPMNEVALNLMKKEKSMNPNYKIREYNQWGTQIDNAKRVGATNSENEDAEEDEENVDGVDDGLDNFQANKKKLKTYLSRRLRRGLLNLEFKHVPDNALIQIYQNILEGDRKRRSNNVLKNKKRTTKNDQLLRVIVDGEEIIEGVQDRLKRSLGQQEENEVEEEDETDTLNTAHTEIQNPGATHRFCDHEIKQATMTKGSIKDVGEQIIETVLNRVANTALLNQMLGPGLFPRSPSDNDEPPVTRYRPGSLYAHRIQALIQRLVVDLETVAEEDLRHRTCRKIHCKAKNFLEQVLKVQDEVCDEDALKRLQKSHAQELKTNTGNPIKPCGSKEANQRNKVFLEKLLCDYQALSKSEQVKVEPVRRYLLQQLKEIEKKLEKGSSCHQPNTAQIIHEKLGDKNEVYVKPMIFLPVQKHNDFGMIPTTETDSKVNDASDEQDRTLAAITLPPQTTMTTSDKLSDLVKMLPQSIKNYLPFVPLNSDLPFLKESATKKNIPENIPQPRKKRSIDVDELLASRRHQVLLGSPAEPQYKGRQNEVVEYVRNIRSIYPRIYDDERQKYLTWYATPRVRRRLEGYQEKESGQLTPEYFKLLKKKEQDLDRVRRLELEESVKSLFREKNHEEATPTSLIHDPNFSVVEGKSWKYIEDSSV